MKKMVIILLILSAIILIVFYLPLVRVCVPGPRIEYCNGKYTIFKHVQYMFGNVSR